MVKFKILFVNLKKLKLKLWIIFQEFGVNVFSLYCLYQEDRIESEKA